MCHCVSSCAITLAAPKDLPANGDNHIGAIAHDEEVFATRALHHVGQVIGVAYPPPPRDSSRAGLALPPRAGGRLQTLYGAGRSMSRSIPSFR